MINNELDSLNDNYDDTPIEEYEYYMNQVQGTQNESDDEYDSDEY